MIRTTIFKSRFISPSANIVNTFHTVWKISSSRAENVSQRQTWSRNSYWWTSPLTAAPLCPKQPNYYNGHSAFPLSCSSVSTCICCLRLFQRNAGIYMITRHVWLRCYLCCKTAFYCKPRHSHMSGQEACCVFGCTLTTGCWTLD